MKNIVFISGTVLGVVAAAMTKMGNPPNMGICVVCFYRDIAGALGLHRAAPVQYLRPEIMGILLGAFLSAYLAKEFRARGGSSPLIRFLLGAFLAIGALVFLGCPIRAVLRLAGGDLNAVLGIAGMVAGAYVGTYLLRGGFTLGRANLMNRTVAWVMPAIMVGLLALAIAKPEFIFFSKQGPGSQHALLIISVAAGLLIGFLAQKARICFVGGWRDLFLIRDSHLFSGIVGFFVGALVVNVAFGQIHIGFANQPVAHSVHLWNFAGMMLMGLCATLLGGCPLRQTVLAGEGDTDAGITLMGILTGTAFSHNFLLASGPNVIGKYGPAAVIIGLVFALIIGFTMREDMA